ncbi:MAG: hypothetical protein EA356_00060 [Geminicoccaceae bacterium]|nr:MAG: hypothetical protein EA356_00060 [Geminicoccaceae bacterium]
MKATKRVRLNVVVDETYPKLLEALQAIDPAKRVERMRSLAAIGLVAEGGHLSLAAPGGRAFVPANGHRLDEKPAEGNALSQLSWDDGLLGNGDE